MQAQTPISLLTQHDARIQIMITLQLNLEANFFFQLLVTEERRRDNRLQSHVNFAYHWRTNLEFPIRFPVSYTLNFAQAVSLRFTSTSLLRGARPRYFD